MVRFAVRNIPVERRLQTAAVIFWASQLVICVAIYVIFLALPFLWPLTIAYLIFMLLDVAPNRGGRRVRWLRSLPFWKYYADYFPLKLVKTVDLDPSKNYLFGYHPHGIIGIGAWGNFATEANGFSKLFPGIKLSVCTLASNFHLPLFRDFIMGLGFVSADKSSVQHILKGEPGRSVMIVIGGAAEALDARPGTNDLTLKTRKGFVKLAIKNGAALVPIFSFGENDVYKQLVKNPEGTPIRRVQNYLKSVFGFSMPFFIGRGIFNYDFGLLPLRKPIVSVVGAPIQCPMIPEPDAETVDKYHELYMQSLEKLYHDYKDVYAKNRKHDLRFVH